MHQGNASRKGMPVMQAVAGTWYSSARAVKRRGVVPRGCRSPAGAELEAEAPDDSASAASACSGARGETRHLFSHIRLMMSNLLGLITL